MIGLLFDPLLFQSIQVFFFLELVLRLAVHRLYFFINYNAGWQLVPSGTAGGAGSNDILHLGWLVLLGVDVVRGVNLLPCVASFPNPSWGLKARKRERGNKNRPLGETMRSLFWSPPSWAWRKQKICSPTTCSKNSCTKTAVWKRQRCFRLKNPQTDN